MSLFIASAALGCARIVIAVIVTVRYVPLTQLHLWPRVFMATLVD